MAVIRLLAEHRPDVLALAEVVSPAVYVEPALLRMARYQLVPQAGAEAEADLWLGPLATPTRRGLVFAVSVLSSLRTRLAADPERFNDAAELVRKAHAEAAPSVRLEEEIIRLSLSDSPDSVLEERLAAVAAAIVQQPGRATDIARWLMLALPRLPERARRSPAAWALSLRAGEQLGSPSPLPDAPALDLGRWRAFASVRRPSGSPTAVRLLGDGLRIGAAAGPGDHEVAVPPTSPRIVEVGVADARMIPVSFREGERRNVSVSTLQLWSGQAGDLRLSWPERITAVAAAAGGRSVAVGFPGGRVELRDAQTGALRNRREFGSVVTGLAVAGTRILVGTAEGVGIWDPEGGAQTVLLGVGRVAVLEAPASGSYVVTAAGSQVAVYELPSGHRMAFDSVKGEVTAVATPGELILFVVSGTVYVADSTLRRVRALESRVPAQRIAAPSDYQLAVLGADRQVWGWQPASGESLGVVARGAGPVVDVAVVGGALVTAGTDRLLRRWTGPDLALESGRQRYEGQLYTLAGAASADLIASGSHGGPLILRSLAGDAWRLEPAAADDGPLGALADGEGTRFAVFSSVADAVEVCLIDSSGETRVPLEAAGDGMWQGYVPGVHPGQRYGYRVHGPYEPVRGRRCSPSKLLLDPYGKALDGEVVWNTALFDYQWTDPRTPNTDNSAPFMPTSVVINPSFDWGNDRPPRTPYQETVIYEAHVRGFTMRHPDVPPDQRGTYSGLAHPAVIEYLARLGVTAVQLMPVHQFLPEQQMVARGLTNYWGYNTIAFLAPHNGYASTRVPGGQVDEFKTMVKAFHAAGIEVILDVDYSHTAEGDGRGPTLAFRGIDNTAYYRLDDQDQWRYLDYSGSGNSLNMASPRVLQLIMESLRYWVTDMHVDGFQFTLAATLARERRDVDMHSAFFALVQQDPVVSQVKLIAEPWDVGQADSYNLGRFPALWREWNGRYRDSMRDFWRGKDVGVAEFATRFSGSSDLYGGARRRPTASVNLITVHDGFTLRDLVSYNAKHNEANTEANRDGTDDNRSWNCGAEGPTDDPEVNALRERQSRAMLTTLLLSFGMPLLLGGDEIGRTQQGNNNAYCQDNEISWVDWVNADSDLLAFTRRLIAFRKAHPVFRRNAFLAGAEVSALGWFTPAGTEMTSADWSDQTIHAIAVYLDGSDDPDRAADGTWLVDDDFLVLVNAWWQPLDFVLPVTKPQAAWKVEIDTYDPGSATDSATIRRLAGDSVTAGPRSIVLLMSERDTVEAEYAAKEE